MTGPHDSVIGVKTELATHRMRTGMPVRFEVADGRRPDRGRARRVRRRERPGDARSGRFGFPGPEAAVRVPLHDEGAKTATSTRSRTSTSHEAVGIELLHELPVVAREPHPRERARGDEQRDRGDAPGALDEHHDREQPDQELRRDDLAERDEGDDRRGRVARRTARRSRRRRGRSAPRRAARAATPAIVVTAEATAATVPVRFCEPEPGRPAERHAERVVEREQHARARGSRSAAAARAGARRSAPRPRARGSRTGGRSAATCRRSARAPSAPPAGPRAARFAPRAAAGARPGRSSSRSRRRAAPARAISPAVEDRADRRQRERWRRRGRSASARTARAARRRRGTPRPTARCSSGRGAERDQREHDQHGSCGERDDHQRREGRVVAVRRRGDERRARRTAPALPAGTRPRSRGRARRRSRSARRRCW